MNMPSHICTTKGRPPAGQDRRARILDNALILFAEQGVSGTTVAQIAQAAGVTSAMVHYYFHTREGLLDALVDERLAPRIQYIWEWVSEDTCAEPQQIVTEIITRLLDVVDAMPQLPQLWNREIFHANGCMRERLMRHVPLEKFARVRDSLLQAQRTGRVHPDISPDLVVTSAISLIMLPLAARKFFQGFPVFPTVEKEKLGKHAITLMLHGLLTNNGEQP